MKSSILRTVLALVLVLSFSLITALPAWAEPDVTITEATGGDAISADTNAAGGTGAWTDLGPISVNETAATDIDANQIGVTLILSVPDGFEFDAGQIPSISAPAGDITALGRTISASNITITFTTDNDTHLDTITIGAGPVIRVRPTAGTPLATGNITRDATSNSTIAVIDGNTNFGTLTEVAGAITLLTIIQQPTDTLVNVHITPSVTVRATDNFTNNVSGQNIAVALQAGIGALTATSPQPTNGVGIAAFDDLKIDTVGPGKVLRFSFGGVTVDSNPFTIVTYGITVNPTAGLITTESGGTDTFTIVLDTQPTDNVTIGLTSSDTSEGVVSADNVTFTTLNWNVPQIITVTGVDDGLFDGDIPYYIITAAAVSADANYNNLNASDVSVINMNDEIYVEQTPPPIGGVTDISSAVTSGGLFTQDVTVSSGDNMVEVTIDQGVIGQTANGQPLSTIIILTMNFPPAPPEQASVIGLTYDFRPSRTTFSEPVTITFTYNPNNLSAGIDENNLSIAYYEEATGEWVVLDNITHNPTIHAVSGDSNHFTAFAVMAFTQPASFTVSNLTLSPAEVNVGEVLTISVTITNTGDLSGTYDVLLKIDDTVIETTQVTLGGHASQIVNFALSRDTAGIYNVSIGTLSAVLTVKEVQTQTPAPTLTPEPTITQTPAPSPTQEPTPSPSQTASPSPTPTSTPTTTPAQTSALTPAPATESGTKWWLIGGIIAAVIIFSGALWFLMTHRRD